MNSMVCNLGALRSIALLLFVTSALFSQSQTSDELREKYGKSTVETFTVKPLISLTAAYATDGQPCQFVLETPHPIIRRSDEQATYMPTDEISKLIDELSSPNDRGEQMKAFVSESGCNTYAVTEYERVVISRSQHNCQPESPNRDGQVVITFKQRACKWQ
jgi:hypothetical protein